MNNKPALQVKNLSIGFHEKKETEVISENINFSLNKSQLICLVGPNGAGKSTLLRTITGLQKPLSGQITLNDKDIQSLSPTALAKELSVVLTEKVLLSNLTVYDVVSLGRHPFTNWIGKLTSEDHKIIQKALQRTQSLSLKDKDFTHLSDGERQKVMISRALAQGPTILVLDEPTAFLDFPHRVEIMRTMKQLTLENDFAIILSTHDLSLAITTADLLIMIDSQGSISHGAPEDLILQGKFEQAFNPENSLIFNPFDATFHFNNNQGPVFSVQSDDKLRRHWTEKALHRIGFQTREKDAPNIIEYKQSPKPIWKCCFEGETSHHNTIHELVTYLRNTFH